MLRIATHNSATGEKPCNFLSWLSIPFARTQSKTITEQFLNGCRLFDIRVKMHNNEWHCAHGLFITKKSVWSILQSLNNLAESDQENPTIVNIVYEGRLAADRRIFKIAANTWMNMYTNIQFGDFYSKYPNWDRIVEGNQKTFYPPNLNYKQYKSLDFSSWHTLIPIPWLWKQFYFKYPVFNEECFSYVDFL